MLTLKNIDEAAPGLDEMDTSSFEESSNGSDGVLNCTKTALLLTAKVIQLLT